MQMRREARSFRGVRGTELISRSRIVLTFFQGYVQSKIVWARVHQKGALHAKKLRYVFLFLQLTSHIDDIGYTQHGL